MAEEMEGMEDKKQELVDEFKGRVEQILQQHEEDLVAAECLDPLQEGVMKMAEDLAQIAVTHSGTSSEEEVNGVFEEWMSEAGAIPDEVSNALNALRETFTEEIDED